MPRMQPLQPLGGQNVIEGMLEPTSCFTCLLPATRSSSCIGRAETLLQDCEPLMQISERMWSLWPQIIQCFYEWAVDYFDHIAGALENYISKGTERFLQPTPGYLQQVPDWQNLALSLDACARFPSMIPCLSVCAETRSHLDGGRGLSTVQAWATASRAFSIPNMCRSAAAQGVLGAVAAESNGGEGPHDDGSQ